MGYHTESVRSSKDSWISYLGVIGTLGPLLGLVGTVSGMIGAFKSLGEAQGAPDATKLADSISHALVVTLVGVGIAVPAIFFFTFRGILDNFSGFIYRSDDNPPLNGDFSGDFVEMKKLRSHWFWAAST